MAPGISIDIAATSRQGQPPRDWGTSDATPEIRVREPPGSRTPGDESSPLRALGRCGPPPCPYRGRELAEIEPHVTPPYIRETPCGWRADPFQGAPLEGFREEVLNW